MLLETAAVQIPYEALTLSGALAIAVVALWLLNGKLAGKNEKLQAQQVAKAEADLQASTDRAERLTLIIEENTRAAARLSENVQAMTKAFEANTRVNERVLDRLQN